MKKLLLAILILVFASPAFAYRDYNDDECRYRGSSGTHYEYDLSRPSDQIRYELDLGAQMRDELSVDPRRDLDRNLGQYGGGICR